MTIKDFVNVLVKKGLVESRDKDTLERAASLACASNAIPEDKIEIKRMDVNPFFCHTHGLDKRYMSIDDIMDAGIEDLLRAEEWIESIIM